MRKERLVELLDEGLNEWSLSGWASSSLFKEMSEHLADYLLANGVIVPPCNVGDVVYVTEHNTIYEPIRECKVEEIAKDRRYPYIVVAPKDCSGHRWAYAFNLIGKKVFLTEEEAEAKLKEMSHDKAD